MVNLKNNILFSTIPIDYITFNSRQHLYIIIPILYTFGETRTNVKVIRFNMVKEAKHENRRIKTKMPKMWM